MYIAILGRQPKLSLAELEQLYGSASVKRFSPTAALVEGPFDFEQLGGSLKAGEVVLETHGNWRAVSQQLIDHYLEKWGEHEGKVTLGISVYDARQTTPRDIQQTGVTLKKLLKKRGVSLRLVPNKAAALSTATSHHNKLGLSNNHVELLIVNSDNGVIIAESIGAQNISALAARDQARPKRDAFVGMLPPKLARMMVNLALPENPDGVVLDPFCGTGTVLQEAALLGFNVFGSDLSEKMVDYSTANMQWLVNSHNLNPNVSIVQGDAVTTQWLPPIDAVVSEIYLGLPFSAPPSAEKLAEVRGTCNKILEGFLTNVGNQIAPGTPVCLAVPAWRGTDGHTTHLPAVSRLEDFGFTVTKLTHVHPRDLLYFREDQVVARQLLLLKKA